MKKQKIDRIIHAGDLVGYNAMPNEVIQNIKENNIFTIAGNHDLATATGQGLAWFNSDARSAVQWTKKKIGKAGIEYLLNLKPRKKTVIDGRTIMIIHGHPDDDNHYTYESEAKQSLLDETGADILIMGHTHVPYVKKFKSGLIINPGSVGQPRDGNWKVSCAVLDLSASDAKIFRLEYPVEKMMNANYDARLPEMLAERLRMGI